MFGALKRLVGEGCKWITEAGRLSTYGGQAQEESLWC